MSLDLSRYCQGLRLQDDGVYRSDRIGQKIHFPEGGHAVLEQIEDASFWFRHRNKCIAAIIKRHGCSGPLFDVGGGNGFVARCLANLGQDLVLVEPSPIGCLAARRRGLPAVINADFSGAGFLPGLVPAFGLFDVIEHVEDDLGFFRNLHEALAVGGKVYVTTPAYSWLWSDVDAVSGHFRRYNRTSLCKLATEAGLAVSYVTYFFQLLVPAVFSARVLAERLAVRPRRADSPQREHAPGVTARLLERLLAYEVLLLASGRSLSFGSSLLMVATKED